jgi:hypothetical protein
VAENDKWIFFFLLSILFSQTNFLSLYPLHLSPFFFFSFLPVAPGAAFLPVAQQWQHELQLGFDPIKFFNVSTPDAMQNLEPCDST